MNKAVRIGIVGVSGYSGMETARLIAAHPAFALAAAVSDKWAGTAVGDHLPVAGPPAGRRGRRDKRRRQRNDGRGQEEQRALLVLRGRWRLPGLPRAAPPAHAGDRARAGLGWARRGSRDVHAAPPADTAGDPRDDLRSAA